MIEDQLTEALNRCAHIFIDNSKNVSQENSHSDNFFESMVVELEHTGFDYPIWNAGYSKFERSRMAVYWLIIEPVICDVVHNEYHCGIELYVHNCCKIAVYKTFKV
ncbi:hypothetical protein [Shewanella sp. 6_MG-2023]|uniref:hypothetical protein n=1 Tax=Shewanella sp. 6_MG-2023 TaxID=3062660 RepID=UPI0026E30E9F|nr:hypothetical protein [Shewanella sp. 6_MG-2023]MDO6617661.1 hypothetical protein [Shewanella sp. 6_MG-2023]